jgi:hypothetical protein
MDKLEDCTPWNFCAWWESNIIEKDITGIYSQGNLRIIMRQAFIAVEADYLLIIKR